MPQVPLPQVSDSAFQSPQLTSPLIQPIQDVTGQQIQQQGQAMSQLGGQLAAIAADINEEHATATAKGALNKWSEFADKVDLDYRNQIGQAASHIDGKPVDPGEAPNDAANRMKAEIERLESGLSQDLAKQVFREHAERGMVAYRGRMSAHEVKQIKVHTRAEDLAQTVRRATAYGVNGNPADFKAAVDSTNETADSDGLGPEARKARLLGVQTAMHSDYVSNLLGDGDTKGADEELRKIPKGEIDAKTRGQLRRKIDGVLSAEQDSKSAIDLVLNGGVLKADATSPAQYEATLEAEVAKVTPLSGLAASGKWRESLSSPQVITALPDSALDLDLEISRERFTDEPGANHGVTWGRAMKTLEAQYRSGKITADQYRSRQRVVSEQISLRIRTQSAAAAGTLQEVEKILVANPGLTVQSPSFKAEHPDLYEDVVSQQLLLQAKGMSDRQTAAAAYSMLKRKTAHETLGDMSGPQFYATFFGRLDKVDYDKGYRDWKELQKGAGPLPEGIEDRRIDDEIGEAGLYTGKDARGRFVPNKDVPEEMERSRQIERLKADRRAKNQTFDTTKEIHEFVTETMLRPAKVPIKPDWFWSPWDTIRGNLEVGMETELELQQGVREAKAATYANATEKRDAIEAAEKRILEAVRPVVVDNVETFVTTKGGRLTGIQEVNPENELMVSNRVPQEEAEFLTDSVRLRALERMANNQSLLPDQRPTQAYVDAVRRQMIAVGALSPDRLVGEDDRKNLNQIYAGAGIGMPAIDMQVKMVRAYRRKRAHDQRIPNMIAKREELRLDLEEKTARFEDIMDLKPTLGESLLAMPEEWKRKDGK